LLQDQRVAYEENIKLENLHVDFKIGDTVVLFSGNKNKNFEGGLYSELLIKRDFLKSKFEVVILDVDEWEKLSEENQITYLWENKVIKKKLKY